MIQLFQQLMQLCANSDAFYYQDFTRDQSTYRIFNYRLASYSDFMQPSALEIRGTMFEVDAAGNAMRLASRPMQKYFNINENPMTMNLDLSKVDSIELKADGSLISTYMHQGQLAFKSRGSIGSEQAVDATAWINLPENREYKATLIEAEYSGLTVNMEWCAPHNRIVIGYVKPHLTVLNARHRDDGSYLPRQILEEWFGVAVIPEVDLKGKSIVEFVNSIPAMLDDIEGYVVKIGKLWFKSKTDKYMSLHHTKDSITNPHRLFDVVLDEGTDDLRSMFATDAVAVAAINEMETYVVELHNKIVKLVEAFHAENKELSRKDYAIKGQASMEHMYFGLAMLKYVGKEINYKDWMKSKYKEFNVAQHVKGVGTSE